MHPDFYATVRRRPAGGRWYQIRCAPAEGHFFNHEKGPSFTFTRGVTAEMELLLLFFLVLITAAAAAGRVVDSRDYADWRPTRGGFRNPPA
jgi:hypothetical protein